MENMGEGKESWKLVESAVHFQYALDSYVQLDIAAMAVGGDLKKIYDFARVDIPLLIAATNQRLGDEKNPVFDLGEARINVKLDFEPKALADSMNSNFEAAKKSLDWIYPQLSDQAKAFMAPGDDGVFAQMSKTLIDQREEFYNRPKDISMVLKLNGKPFDIDRADPRSKLHFHLQMAGVFDEQFRSLKTGERVRVDMKIVDFKDDTLNVYSTSYAVSNAKGETKTVDCNDFAKHDIAYGIVMERENKTYFVPTTDGLHSKARPDGEAREIVGLSHEARRFHLQHCDQLEPAEALDSYKILREATCPGIAFLPSYEMGSGGKILRSGEFHFVSAVEPGWQKGPIMIEAVPWTSGVREDEKQAAICAIELYENRYENSNIIGISNPKNTVYKEDVLDKMMNKPQDMANLHDDLNGRVVTSEPVSIFAQAQAALQAQNSR